MQRVLEAFARHLDIFAEENTARVFDAEIPFYMGFPRDTLLASIKRTYEAVRSDLEQGTVEFFPRHIQALGRLRASQSSSLTDMIRGFGLGFAYVSEHFATLFAADPEARLFWEQRRNDIMLAGAAMLADTFVEVREERIREQTMRLAELSAPLIPLTRGVLVLPLVGRLDTERAENITWALLEAIAKHRSEVVIIDITGVPTGDEAVVDHLIRAARSSRLLGAQVVLVGLSPAIAQMIAQSNTDMGDIETLGDLEAGLAYALRLRGLSIAKLDGASPSRTTPARRRAVVA